MKKCHSKEEQNRFFVVSLQTPQKHITMSAKRKAEEETAAVKKTKATEEVEGEEEDLGEEEEDLGEEEEDVVEEEEEDEGAE